VGVYDITPVELSINISSSFPEISSKCTLMSKDFDVLNIVH
jgi:hypothetical protein